MCENLINAAETPLSSEARAVLVWLRDTPHHIARCLVKGREPTIEPPSEWTHIELRGNGGKRRCVPLEVWREIGPFSSVSEEDSHMFAPTVKGLEILKSSERN